MSRHNLAAHDVSPIQNICRATMTRDVIVIMTLMWAFILLSCQLISVAGDIILYEIIIGGAGHIDEINSGRLH